MNPISKVRSRAAATLRRASGANLLSRNPVARAHARIARMKTPKPRKA